ncbi:MAG: hydrogenase/urease maturation nickel metallochaperone HypA [Gemmatimonadaceae bacterium]
MHEMSLAMEIARIAEVKLGATAPQLVTVAVDVGDSAGIEQSSLEFCLEAVFATPPFAGAKPRIVRCAGDVLRVAYLEIDDGRPDD